MSPITSFITTLLAVATLASQIVIVLGILYLLFSKKIFIIEKLLDLIERRSLILALVVSLTSTILSLYYSDIAGFAPCVLCWWQRVFMYPQVVILLLALTKKDKNVFQYCLLLSILGAIVAIYNSYLQYGGTPFIACSSSAAAVSCSRRFIFAFDYITFPLMSLTSFVILIGLYLLPKIRRI